jgi:hypothetical protein
MYWTTVQAYSLPWYSLDIAEIIALVLVASVVLGHAMRLAGPGSRFDTGQAARGSQSWPLISGEFSRNGCEAVSDESLHWKGPGIIALDKGHGHMSSRQCSGGSCVTV